MQIGDNMLHINDWKIKKFLIFIFTINVAMWGVISLESMHSHMGLLRQIIGFIYLTLVPGACILRILKLHKLSNTEVISYSVGLSLAILMFTGLSMNIVYPHIGIHKPISLIPLLITISLIMLILCALSYIRDKNYINPGTYVNPGTINIGDALSPPALFLIAIPFISIFGAHLLNYKYNNIFLLLLIPILGVIAFLITYNLFIPAKLYAFAIYIIGLSLLLHGALISMYISGYDIHLELYLADLVRTNSVWDPEFVSNVNAMLSIVMLAPIYSIVLDLGLVWVFKVVYPIIFSLVPICLYRVYVTQTNSKVAFLSCFFFVSLFVFYSDMLQLARQQIAELFFVLLILLMINKNMDKTSKSFLLVVFGASISVSHYGLAYVYIIFVLLTLLILCFDGKYSMQKIFGGMANSDDTSRNTNGIISPTFVIFFIIFTLGWYMYVTKSWTFFTIVQIGHNIVFSIISEFLNPDACQGLAIILDKKTSLLHDLFKYVHLLTLALITLGVISSLLSVHKDITKFVHEYRIFSLISFTICISGIILPYFASSINTSRLYHLNLFILAPFCIIGGITIFWVICRIVGLSFNEKHFEISLPLVSVILVIYLLFNTGWIFEIAGQPIRPTLNSTLDGPYFTDKEVSSAKWLVKVKSNDPIYADEYRRLLLYGLTWMQTREINNDQFKDIIADDAFYIYLGTLNVKEHRMIIRNTKGVVVDLKYMSLRDIFSDMFDGTNKIYANDGAAVYYHRASYLALP